ncbi:MAG: ComF family protein [Hydrococcus sp. Prado102]|nr:ComF family protein [Hydrococcus sp. Prado102]
MNCQNQLKNCQLNNPCQFWHSKLPLFVWWLNCSPYKQTKKITVIPIPLHAKKLQARGFNQAELIARSFCRITNYSLQAQGLERVKETQAMFSLNSLDDRKNNLRDAFVLGKGLKKGGSVSPVLLIDDIYTTGTTVNEAAKLLRDRNILVLGVGAIAKTNFK